MKPWIVIALVSLLYNHHVAAQCAMCKATSSQGSASGETETLWINFGIISLMSVPFILLMVLYLLYRKNFKNESQKN